MSIKPVANEAETASLLRMAESRDALLVANSTASITPARVAQSAQHPVPTLVTSLAGAPRVALVLALCVGAIVLGPRRAVGITSRAGVTAWLAGAARNVILNAI
jgi:hypothetical protein